MLEEIETQIRLIVKNEYLKLTPKYKIDKLILDVINKGLKKITILDLQKASRLSLLDFYNRQYKEMSRINGYKLLLLLACIKVTDKGNTLVKMPVSRAETIIKEYAPLVEPDILISDDEINSFGVPLQKFSKDYIDKDVKPIFKRLSQQYPFDPDDYRGKDPKKAKYHHVNSLRNRAEMEARYNGHLENIKELAEQGNRLVIASTHNDCSERCREWQGRVYSLDGTSGKTDDGRDYVPLEEATDVWYQTKAGKWYKNGLLGFNCFSDDTEIYTNQGWKLFKDLDGTELIYTLNTETRLTEWQKPTEYYKAEYNGEMVHFNNHSLDILVTPNHNMLYYTQKNSKLRFKEAKDCTKATFFTAGQEWNVKDKDTVLFGGQEVETDLYCKFMAYWLSDGSIHSNTAVKIAQQNNDSMYEELSRLPFNAWKDDNKILVYGKELVQELKQYGTCTTKYVPDTIKNLSKRQINVFLDAYLSTDGYVAKTSYINGHKRKPHKQLFTTSKRMADDLCELSLKAGYRPKVEIRANKGKEIEFRNGTYTINNDLYVIHLNYNVNVTHYSKETVSYSGFVYCVQVPNHTLLVKRKGTVIWCGNCRHYLVPYKKGFRFTKASASKEEHEYEITKQQRYLERKVRYWRTEALTYKGTNPDEYKKARKKAEKANERYIAFSKANKRAYYPSRTKII